MSTPGATIAGAVGDIGKLKELRQRLLFVLGALLVFRLGTFIPIPGIDPNVLAQLADQQRGTILDMFNMFSGGALERLSIFALGIMPYISASIIMQLLSVTVPTLEQLKRKAKAGGARLRSTPGTAPLSSRPCRQSGFQSDSRGSRWAAVPL